jgi:hypothetical protein
VKVLNKPTEAHRTRQMGEVHLCVLNSAAEFEGNYLGTTHRKKKIIALTKRYISVPKRLSEIYFESV